MPDQERALTELTRVIRPGGELRFYDHVVSHRPMDGDPGPGGLLGAKVPHPFDGRWRLFFTQQHGDNHMWEVEPAGRR